MAVAWQAQANKDQCGFNTAITSLSPVSELVQVQPASAVKSCYSTLDLTRLTYPPSYYTTISADSKVLPSDVGTLTHFNYLRAAISDPDHDRLPDHEQSIESSPLTIDLFS